MKIPNLTRDPALVFATTLLASELPGSGERNLRQYRAPQRLEFSRLRRANSNISPRTKIVQRRGHTLGAALALRKDHFWREMEPSRSRSRQSDESGREKDDDNEDDNDEQENEDIEQSFDGGIQGRVGGR